jgi:hypothetical protein
MMDMRLTVDPAVFQQYLEFFSSHLRAVKTRDDGGVGMHTVRCCSCSGQKRVSEKRRMCGLKAALAEAVQPN